MSYSLTDLVMAHGPIDRMQRDILMALAKFADEDGECFPHSETVCRLARCVRSTFFKHVALMEADGWLQRGKRFNAIGAVIGSTYLLNVARLEQFERVWRSENARLEAERKARRQAQYKPFPEDAAEAEFHEQERLSLKNKPSVSRTHESAGTDSAVRAVGLHKKDQRKIIEKRRVQKAPKSSSALPFDVQRAVSEFNWPHTSENDRIQIKSWLSASGYGDLLEGVKP